MMIAGYGTAFGVVSNNSYVIGRGAFANLIRGGWVPRMLLGHEGEAIGTWLSIFEDERGLKMIGRIDPGRKRGRLAARMAAAGDAGSLSLGPILASRKPLTPTVSFIREVLALDEVSIVTDPGNPRAVIEAFAERIS